MDILGDCVVLVETACWTRKSDEAASGTAMDTFGMGESKTATSITIATLRRPHEVEAGQKGSDQQTCLRRVRACLFGTHVTTTCMLNGVWSHERRNRREARCLTATRSLRE